MSTKANILVVDDNPVLRDLLCDTLDAVGYQAYAASDGVEALEELRRKPAAAYDLLLTDIKMPNMDGFALLKKIRRTYPELPVLLITGVISEEAMVAASPDGYLSKPFRIARLEELIESTLAAKYSSHPVSPSRQVLIYVSRPDLRESLAEAMSFSNYLPFAVTNPDEAWQELERGTFDAVITDGEAAETANSFVNRLKENYPTLPMLFTKLDEKAESDHQAVRADNNTDCVDPRFNASELIALLDRTVAAGNHPTG